MLKFNITNPPTEEMLEKDSLLHFFGFFGLIITAIIIIIITPLIFSNDSMYISTTLSFILVFIAVIVASLSYNYIDYEEFSSSMEKGEILDQIMSFQDGGDYICKVRQQGRRITDMELSGLHKEYQKRESVRYKRNAEGMVIKFISQQCKK